MKKSTKLLMWLVSVCLVAGIGVFIYTRLHKEDTKLASSTASSQATTQQPVTSTGETPAQTVKPTNQFDIPELGIKMTVPNGLEDITYKVSSDSTSDASIVYFSSKGILKDSDCAQSYGTIGAIARSAEDPKMTNLPKNSYQWAYVGNKYFILQAPQQPCSRSSDINALQTKQTQLLKEAFSSIKER